MVECRAADPWVINSSPTGIIVEAINNICCITMNLYTSYIYQINVGKNKASKLSKHNTCTFFEVQRPNMRVQTVVKLSQQMQTSGEKKQTNACTCDSHKVPFISRSLEHDCAYFLSTFVACT